MQKEILFEVCNHSGQMRQKANFLRLKTKQTHKAKDVMPTWWWQFYTVQNIFNSGLLCSRTLNYLYQIIFIK